jgi:hypothetical protein
VAAAGVADPCRRAGAGAEPFRREEAADRPNQAAVEHLAVLRTVQMRLPCSCAVMQTQEVASLELRMVSLQQRSGRSAGYLPPQLPLVRLSPIAFR